MIHEFAVCLTEDKVALSHQGMDNLMLRDKLVAHSPCDLVKSQSTKRYTAY